MISVEQIEGPSDALTYIVGDEVSGLAVWIDPGHSVEEAKRRLHSKGWKLVGIFLTHGHLVHTARAAEARLSFGDPVPVYVHPDELIALQALPMEGERANLCGVKSPTIEKFLKEGDRISFGKNTVGVFETSGHTKGSLSFQIGSHWFVGDLETSGKKKISGLVKPEDRIYPGHGFPFDAEGLSVFRTSRTKGAR